MHIFKTEKKKSLPYENGFFYTRKRTNKQHIVWICRNARCSGQIKTTLQITDPFIVQPHNHIIDSLALTREELKQTMRIKAEETSIAPNIVIKDALSAQTPMVILGLGCQSALERKIQRIR